MLLSNKRLVLSFFAVSFLCCGSVGVVWGQAFLQADDSYTPEEIGIQEGTIVPENNSDASLCHGAGGVWNFQEGSCDTLDDVSRLSSYEKAQCQQEYDAGNLDDKAYSTCKAKACMTGCGDRERCICNCKGGISLNTNVPFIGNCILSDEQAVGGDGPNSTVVTEVNAFPLLTKGITRLLLSLIVAVTFLLAIVAGVLWTTGGANANGKQQAIGIWQKIFWTYVALGSIGMVLRLINPTFFG